MAPSFVGSWQYGTLGQKPISGSFGFAPSEAIYDLASLTKVMVTGALLVEEWLAGDMSWEAFRAQSLIDAIPEFRDSWLARVSLWEYWEHRSGLAPYRDFFDPPRGGNPPQPRAEKWKIILDALSRESEVRRGTTVYSDLGLLALGAWLERRHDRDLTELFDDFKKSHGLPADSLTYDVRRYPERLARTMRTEERNPEGEVNDDRAASLGGCAPHAGLFGSASEIWAWLQAVLRWRESRPELDAWLRPKMALTPEGEPRFHGGWDRPAPNPQSLGGYPTPEGVIGHMGWTGTGFWWHPPTKRAAILLTNRVHPRHTPESLEEIRALRRNFFSAHWQGKLSPGWKP